VTVFLKFQKRPIPITTVRNNNVITGYTGPLLPLSEVYRLTVWSGVAMQLNYWPQCTRVTLRAPTELTDWPLAPESYVIIHYYIASDCWSTDSSENCKQLYHIGLRIGLRVVSKLSYAAHAMLRTHSLQPKHRNTQLVQDANDSILASVCVFFVCMHCVAVFLSTSHDQNVLHPLHCIRQLGNWPLSPFSAFWRRPLCFNIQHV